MNPERLDRLINQPTEIQWQPSYWFLNPKSPFWGREVVAILCLGILQVNILPAISGHLQIIDLLTPILTIAAIRLPYTRVAIVYATTCLFLETHHSFAAGFFFCCYAVLVSVILFIRDQISWRQQSAWFTTIASASGWTALFATFVYTVTLGTVDTTLTFWLGSLVKFGISFCVGVGFIRLLKADALDKMGVTP